MPLHRLILRLLVSLGMSGAGASPSGTNKSKCPNAGTSDHNLFNCSTTYTAANGFYPIPTSDRHPVMLVPSMIGSYLQRRLHNSKEPYPICWDGGWMGGSDWYDMWPPAGFNMSCKDITCLPSDLYPLYADCWGHDLTLAYDSSTDTYSDPPGVTIRANGTLELMIDPNVSDLPEYACLGQMLKAVGYIEHQDFESLGYDWRKSPGDWMVANGYYLQLKGAIETLRQKAGKPVVPVSFSLGGPVFNVFLTRYVDQTWKDENIYKWLSLSGTFGGVQESLMQQISYNGSLMIPSMKETHAVAMMRSWGSQNWMGATIPPNEVVVNVTGTYTKYLGKDVGKLFQDIQQPSLAAAWQHNQYSRSEAAPGVEVYVISGSGAGTPYAYEFPPDANNGPDMSQEPKVYCDPDGDDTSTHDGLFGVPTRWQAQGTQQNKPVHLISLPNVSHANTVSQPVAATTLYSMLK